MAAMHRHLKQKLLGNETEDATCIAIDGLQHVLDVFAEAAGDFGTTSLQKGVTGLSTVFAMIQKSHVNAEDIDKLAEKVGDLTRMVKECAELHESNIPPAMQARVDQLLSSWKVVDDEAADLKSRNKLLRKLNADKETKKVINFVQRLSRSIESFMEGAPVIEIPLDGLSKKSSQHGEKKPDVIQNDVQRLRAFLSEGNSLLPYAASAPFDCRPERIVCLEGTCTDTLKSIYTWALGQHTTGERADSTQDFTHVQSRILFLNSPAGTGKTTIAYTVAERCRAEGVLGASFFCSRLDTDCSRPSMIFTTIAYQLGLFCKPYKDRVAEILQKDPLLVYSGVSHQFRELIMHPLAQLCDNFPPCVVVIDALDQCPDHHAASEVVSALLKHGRDLYRLRFFVTSCPEHHIITSFDTPGYCNAVGQPLVHKIGLEPESVTADIERYLTVVLSDIPECWPGKASVVMLTQLANGLFISAATAVKYIEDRRYSDPIGQLKVLTPTVVLHGPYQFLDQLYLRVLESAFSDISEGSRLPGRLDSVLAALVAVVQDPLSIPDLSRLVRLTAHTVYTSLVRLRPVLIVPALEDSPSSIHVIHPTFVEFLLDSSRCTSRSLSIGSGKQHAELLHGCLEALQELRRDICDIRDPSLLNIEVPDLSKRIEKAIPARLRYACRRWWIHLINGELSDKLLDALLEFAQKQLLYWVEACSLLGVLRDAISGLSESRCKLMGLNNGRARRIARLLNDCERLIIGFLPAISGSTLQLYHSVLPLTPRKTTLAWTFANEHHAESSISVYGGVADSWDTCLGTVMAHEGKTVYAVDYSPDGRTVVSSGNDCKIRLWDAPTCSLLLVLSGHSDCVNSVKYSPDGAHLVSAADDCTIKIWDAVSGMLIHTLRLEAHAKFIPCAVFMPDGGHILSGSDDGSIKIWDAGTGVCLTTLTAHQDRVLSIAVSPNGLWMASSTESLVCLWSLEAPYTHRVLQNRENKKTSYSVIFAPDSSKILIAPGGGDSGQLSVWDVKTAERLHDIQLSLSICSPSFVSTGDKLVCGSGSSVLVLDIASGEVRQAFAGHTKDVTSVAHSRDGTRIVSGSWDGTIRLWDTTQDAVDVPRLGNAFESSDPSSEGSGSVDCRLAVFSRDESRALLIHDNGSVKVGKTDTGDWAFNSLSLSPEDEHYAAFSPDGAAILTASQGDYDKIALWDTTSGSLRAQIEGELWVALWSPLYRDVFMWNGVLGYKPHCFGGQSSSIMFSPNSQYLLTGTISGAESLREHSACLWDVATGKLLREFVGHSDDVFSTAFSLDNSRIATGSRDGTVIIWDVGTGASLATFMGHHGWIRSIAFSPNGDRVASGSDNRRLLVWSIEGGELLQLFEEHTDWVWSVAFAPGGDVIISSDDKNMRLWDIETGACLLVLNPDTWYHTIPLSPDGSGVLVDNGERLVELWAPLDVDTQATTLFPWLPRRTWPMYYEEDGWIFSLTPTRRTRLFWVPVDWQGIVGYLGQNVVFGKQCIRLNFSALNSYLEDLCIAHVR